MGHSALGPLREVGWQPAGRLLRMRPGEEAAEDVHSQVRKCLNGRLCGGGAACPGGLGEAARIGSCALPPHFSQDLFLVIRGASEKTYPWPQETSIGKGSPPGTAHSPFKHISYFSMRGSLESQLSEVRKSYRGLGWAWIVSLSPSPADWAKGRGRPRDASQAAPTVLSPSQTPPLPS